ncbi:MAG TPA: MotA/TolQ/ExbB proton channel family protein [Verrucomicrobiae bacterium]|nr:MotA/TolQ/ExbB proton channel family protein [Verrucomicrobiae bacterium]
MILLFETKPVFAAGALQFAFDKATTEGKITIGALVLISLFSWSVIISKLFQLGRAARASAKFFGAFGKTRSPHELESSGKRFEGAPVYELYKAALAELDAQSKASPLPAGKISPIAFEAVRVAIEEAAISETLALEKGMIVLSTAVAGGPFIGLLGTVWGVMETFAGIARANAASLTAMAPGVAGALIATVAGLMVAIPAMFAYNFMVTRIRAFTQELDSFGIKFATQIEQNFVEDHALAEGVRAAIQAALIDRIP